MSDNFLEHFGIKGMKWGIRRKRGSAKQKAPAETAKTLTNKELKKRINRLNMEKQYSKLAEEDATASAKGLQLVTKMLKKSGKQKMQRLSDEIVGDVVDFSLTTALKTGRELSNIDIIKG